MTTEPGTTVTHFSTATTARTLHRLRLCIAVVLGCLSVAPVAWAQELIQGNYYWYVPEHERYAPTVFYVEPTFDSPEVRVQIKKRFRLENGERGWYKLVFDGDESMFIHQRLLRSMLYNAATGDPWHEFQRASVFAEDPIRIQARLKAVRSSPQAEQTPIETKTPSWKRYKDSWGVRTGRTSTLSIPEDAAEGAQDSVPSRSYGITKSRRSLLPPIGGATPPPSSDAQGEPRNSDPPPGTR